METFIPLIPLPVLLCVSSFLFTTRDSIDLQHGFEEFESSKYDRQLGMRKNAFLLSIIGLFFKELVQIGFYAVSGGNWKNGALFCGYYLVTIFIASVSYGKISRNRGWDYTVSLTIIMAGFLASSAMNLISQISIPILFSLGLQLTGFIIVGTTNLSPILIKVLTPSEITPKATPPIKNIEQNESTPLLFDDSIPPPHLKVSESVSCSPLSFLSFSWVTPVLNNAKDLDFLSEEDLPLLAHADQAALLWSSVEGESVQGKKKSRFINELLWIVLKVNKRLFGWQFALAFINAFLYYLPAFFLQRLVLFLETESHSKTNGFLLAFGLFFSLFVGAAVDGQLWYVSNSMLATRIRVQLNSMVFDKTLKRKEITSKKASNQRKEEKDSEDNEKEGSGEEFNSKSQVLNLFTIDVERVADFAIWGFSLMDAPMEIIIGTFFLYQLLGRAALVGIAVSILFLPVNHWASKSFAVVEDQLMSARDKRTSLMNEVISSIRMIKFFAFEKPFEKRILEARDEELKYLRRNFFLEIAFNFIWGSSPILCILAAFSYYTIVMEQKLDPSTAFASLAVFNELRFALNIIPEILVNSIQCLVSLRRISAYLKLPEVIIKDDLVKNLNLLHHQAGTLTPIVEEVAQEMSIGMVNATMVWPVVHDDDDEEEDLGSATPSRRAFELQDISLMFPIGQLSLITGPIGSGKSLMLKALLGEVDLKAGQIIRPTKAIDLPSLLPGPELNDANWIQETRVAYVPQSAWLQSNSIKENILFGLPLNAKRYEAVLAACSLQRDLSNFEDGDETQIGEKGVALSGGMKARVSLARAVYSRAKLLLLDDCLSAVDAHSSFWINEQCLKGPLLAGRTVILVSHQVTLIVTPFVVVLENGRVQFTGTSTEYAAKYVPVIEEEEVVEKVIKPKPKPRFFGLLASAEVLTSEASSASEAEDSESDSEEDSSTKLPAKKMMEDETRKIGRVDNSVWQLYINLSGSTIFWIAFASIYLGTKGLEVSETLWLSIWSRSYNTAIETQPSLLYYLGVYSLLSFAQVIVSTLQWSILYNGSVQVSAKLHKNLLANILRAPLRWFETNSSGRIINRFSGDLEKVDSILPDNVGRSLQLGLGVITTLLVIGTTAPISLLGFFILSFLYINFAKTFSKSARELRRLDSVSKSPLYSIYDEAISGASVIRSFSAEKRFMEEFLSRCQSNVTFYWYLWCTNRWLSIRFALLSAIVVGATAAALLFGHVEASLAGFTLTFALNISNDILFLVRRYTALELTMVAVERIKEYSEVPQEAPAIIESNRPPKGWPLGNVTFKAVNVRYSPELPNVIHDMTFSIKAGEKIGVVGSTGSGKSTLALSLFRFVELHSGTIFIDGIDISTLGLYDLRSNLTIIPQDPSILSGTLRSVLDMFGDYTDDLLLEALKKVSLINTIREPTDEELEAGANRSMFYDLDGEISEGGANCSQGERQLLCMARALLKKSPVLIMDESTSSIDQENDAAISKTIRSALTGSTLIVIAHRLRTIIDFDKVLLLDAGRIVEFAAPVELLKDPSSRFYSLCRATGKHEFKALRKMAEGKKAVAPRVKLSRGLSSKVVRTVT